MFIFKILNAFDFYPQGGREGGGWIWRDREMSGIRVHDVKFTKSQYKAQGQPSVIGEGWRGGSNLSYDYLEPITGRDVSRCSTSEESLVGGGGRRLNS